MCEINTATATNLSSSGEYTAPTNVVLGLGVVSVHELQQFNFNLSLLDKRRLVLHYLYSYVLTLQRVVRLHHLRQSTHSSNRAQWPLTTLINANALTTTLTAVLQQHTCSTKVKQGKRRV